MDKQYKQPISVKGMILLIALFSAVLLATSCGPPWKDKQSKEEAERKELIQKEETKLKRIFDQLSEKHNAIYFPPKEIKTTAYTYELQKFLEKYADRAILFKGYLEDINRTDHGVVVEFICPLSENFFVNKIAVLFKLIASDTQVEQFLKREREELILPSLRYFNGPDYIVMAKVSDLRKNRRYEFGSFTHGEEVEINVEMPSRFVSTGMLIEAVRIPKEETAKNKARFER